MRADRLIAELMLLQNHGKLSASNLAKEMEVSQRTIYRDMLALNSAGIPIYAENGINGGYQLVDGYRTQLTGFNTGELQALFAMNIPAILGELGMGAEAKTAMRKLQASLSQQQSQHSNFMSQRFLYDPTTWDDTANDSINRSILEQLQQAIWNDQRIGIKIQFWSRPGEVFLEIDPYALAIKESQWFLIYHRHDSFRVQNLKEIVEVIHAGTGFQRRESFNLTGIWQTWCENQRQQTHHYLVELLVKETARKAFIAVHGNNIQEVFPDNAGWLPVICRFDRLEDARGKLLQWGGAIRILAPEPLRLAMVDYAEQLIRANVIGK